MILLPSPKEKRIKRKKRKRTTPFMKKKETIKRNNKKKIPHEKIGRSRYVF